MSAMLVRNRFRCTAQLGELRYEALRILTPSTPARHSPANERVVELVWSAVSAKKRLAKDRVGVYTSFATECFDDSSLIFRRTVRQHTDVSRAGEPHVEELRSRGGPYRSVKEHGGSSEYVDWRAHDHILEERSYVNVLHGRFCFRARADAKLLDTTGTSLRRRRLTIAYQD
jgi:hypothetical protein